MPTADTSRAIVSRAVVALAGRRIDAPDVERSRFPLAAVPRVRAALAASLQPAAVHALVCSAACGADLLALDVALRAGVPCHVVLPFAPAIFRRTSVVDRPGGWGPLFDTVLRALRDGAAGTLAVGDARADDPAAYVDTNVRILERAAALAGAGPDAPRRAALIVWDGVPRGPGDATLQFQDAARGAGFVLLPPVLTIAADRHDA